MGVTFKNRLLPHSTVIQNRVIALWALSEAGFGGIMHLLKIPFSGIAIVGLSVFFVSLLAFFSKGSYRTIIKASIIVLLIKMAVSPHSPAPAYFAVWFQGMLGWMLFSVFSFNRVSLVFYAVIALLESAFQKILVLTVYFGMSIWDSINVFTGFVMQQFGFQGEVEISRWLIGAYFLLYTLGALLFAYMTIKVMKTFNTDFSGLKEAFNDFQDTQKTVGKKKKFIGKRTWLGIILLFVLSIIVFINPTAGWKKAMYIFFRSVLVIVAWYILVAPLIKRIFEYFLQKKKKKFATEVANIIDSFPLLKSIAWFAWQKYHPLKGIKNLEQFLSAVIYLSLSFEKDET